MSVPRIRPLALCIFQKDQQILVYEGYDPVKQETFYRPLGGGIEFGEQSTQTAVREMREELHAEICNLRYLGCLENIFVYNGVPGHELIQVYRAEFVDSGLYDGTPQASEIDGSPIKTVWKSLEDLKIGKSPLYPTGLLQLLTAS
ncbi:MAG: NUDIX hydrolase [Candidatus Vecturithrix sp.]|jgi:ADP-ribose pyrophosphatase YjhB (NUDIX family)|nr:NUDIX hydrolase [Candidatus Vecturithrix sp.]